MLRVIIALVFSICLAGVSFAHLAVVVAPTHNVMEMQSDASLCVVDGQAKKASLAANKCLGLKNYSTHTRHQCKIDVAQIEASTSLTQPGLVTLRTSLTAVNTPQHSGPPELQPPQFV